MEPDRIPFHRTTHKGALSSAQGHQLPAGGRVLVENIPAHAGPMEELLLTGAIPAQAGNINSGRE